MPDKRLDTPDRWLSKALALAEGDTPFPWQEELLARFKGGMIERSLDIPTGLGKTGVMAVWLVARAQGAPLPRRLVYVVDRRAVVDQATHVAEPRSDAAARHGHVVFVMGSERCAASFAADVREDRALAVAH